jgi:hypothetical protein
MPATQVRGAQVLDGTIQAQDLDIATVGKAVISKVAQGSGIAISSTGGDSGTGIVTINLAATIPLGVVTQIYIGNKARLTALANGLRLEVQDTGGTWIIQQEWTE